MMSHLAEIIVDVPGDIVRGILVFRAFAVNIGLHQADRLDSRGKWDEDNVMHALQSSQHAGAQAIIETRAPRTLVDMLFIRYGHHQQVAKRTGFLEMYNVPGVNKIKCAMTLHDATPGTAFLIEDCGSHLVSKDFLISHTVVQNGFSYERHPVSPSFGVTRRKR